jgi:predicted PurR-regulated permease PerM
MRINLKWESNFYNLAILFVVICLCGYLIVSTLSIIVQIQSHIERLHEDLGQFTEDFNHGISNQNWF